MSHVTPSAVFSNVSGTCLAISEILWRLPLRVSSAAATRVLECLNPAGETSGKPRTSVWIAMASSIFAPLLAHNWCLLLARPRRGVDANDGLLFPADDDDDDINHKDYSGEAVRPRESRKYGFHGFLYADKSSPSFGKASLEGAGAVWIHAHGGGFYAGEARQYHHTYKRWTRKMMREFGVDLRILAVEYPLSTAEPYPGCVEAMFSAYKFVLSSGTHASQVVIAGDSAGGNAALSTCYRIIEDGELPSPAGVVMLSPWLDLTRSTSGHSPNQPTDWLTTFDSDECRVGAIEQYMGTEVKAASDPRVSPLFRTPSPRLPRQFLSAGTAEVLYADAEKWAEKVVGTLGPSAIERHFASGQVHTFAIGGWLADRGVEEESDWRVLSFVYSQTRGQIRGRTNGS